MFPSRTAGPALLFPEKDVRGLEKSGSVELLLLSRSSLLEFYHLLLFLRAPDKD